jgi:threonylcarbamoyladenosine tRNA methylthiotransferase MtaB
VPKVRPNVHSKPIDEAIDEAKALVAAGHKEIVVTGVCLGAYGRQTVRRTGEQGSRGTEEQGNRRTGEQGSRGAEEQKSRGTGEQGSRRGENLEFRIKNEECERHLAELLDRLAGVKGLARIRVSSLEPGDISEELLDVFCAHPNIMPHIHLSVQSGSDNILRRMGRQYGSAELRGKIALIKSRLDRPAITSDIIVGFPTETQEDFEQTAELAKWAGFSKMHTFPFSVRTGTPAAKLKGRVNSKVIKERAEILRKLGDELAFKFREQFLGSTCDVLLEDTNPISGRCERYFDVQIQKTEDGRQTLPRQSFATSSQNFDYAKHQTAAGSSPIIFPSEKRHGGLRSASTLRYEKNELVKVRITGNGNDGAMGEVSR